MLHTIVNDRGEPIPWRDPIDIRTDLTALSKSIATARERYAAWAAARARLRT